MATAREGVMAKIAEYKDIQAKYEEIVHKLVECLPAGNAHDIEFRSSPNYDTRDLTILKHLCRMTFSGQVVGDAFGMQTIRGKLAFEKIISDDEKQALVTFYFDDLANYGDDPKANSFSHNLLQPEGIEWLATRLLIAFFWNMAAAENQPA